MNPSKSVLVLSVTLVAALAGCSGGESAPIGLQDSDDSFNTGLEALAGAGTAEEITAEEGLPGAEEGVSLSDVLARADRAHQRDESRTVQEYAPATEPEPEPVVVAKAAPPPPKPAPVEKPLSRSEQIARLSADLRAALANDAPRSEAFRNALSLASLSLANPRLSLESDSALTEYERAVVAAVRDLVSTLGSSGADSEAAARAFLRAAEAFEPQRSVKISRVELCTSVAGYGRYQPVGAVFPAGRVNKVIVYTELDRFTHRAAREGDPGRSQGDSASEQWAVEVSQELRMVHDADGSMQWRTPEETLIEVARNRRRDFYLVQSISLPQTLSVGNYALKVIVRDKVSGATDEQIVPVSIVADPALARQR